MLTCKRCNYQWKARVDGRPVECPSCKRRDWDQGKRDNAPRVMELVDPRTGEMRCQVCGSVHYASIRPDASGVYYRGSWQCVKGCNLDAAKKKPKGERREGKEGKGYGKRQGNL